jgi:hypothetical protein
MWEQGVELWHSRGQVRRLGSEVQYSPPSSAEVKIAWSPTSSFAYVFMMWSLMKHKEKSTTPI